MELFKKLKKNCEVSKGPMADYIYKLEEFQKVKGKGKMKKKIKRETDYILRDMMMALVLCHNVTPSYTNGVLNYQASSPDEISFVKFCEEADLKLITRDQE